MAVVILDTLGLKCPIPVLRIAAKEPTMNANDILEVSGDCPTFENDVRKWCDRQKKTLLAINTNGKASTVRIQF